MKIPESEFTDYQRRFSSMKDVQENLTMYWKELANYYKPIKHRYLGDDQTDKRQSSRNPYILDSAQVKALNVQTNGLMNGISSPSRPWFSLNAHGFDKDYAAQAWFEEVGKIIYRIMAQSNFYSAMHSVYADMGLFGTAAMLIYEHEKDVISCYNSPAGEYFLDQDEYGKVNAFGRQITRKVHQIVQMWGVENVTSEIAEKYKRGGKALFDTYTVRHLITPNYGSMPEQFDFVELYWISGAPKGEVLAQTGYEMLPGIFPRWDVTGGDVYGVSPAMEALPDVIQLQHMVKRKGKSLDKMEDPPLLADIQLQHRKKSMVPGGITYVANPGAVGVKPIYQSTPPFREIREDIQAVKQDVRIHFHNDLFQMISSLDTVRTATEIDARYEEKLIQLGPVLTRVEREGLNAGIERIFQIANARGMIPEPPQSLLDADITISYESLLFAAQKAVASAPLERFLGFGGEMAAVFPDIVKAVKPIDAYIQYGEQLGISKAILNSPEDIEAAIAAESAAAADAEMLETQTIEAQNAKVLSDTDVGGGANALQQLLARG